MTLDIEEITELFQSLGAVPYGTEAISQQQHALQCAHLAESAGASPALIAAALLHDLGQLLVVKGSAKATAAEDWHQYVAVPFLRGMFPDAVLAPIRMHVDAKRYLCWMEKLYWGSLSPASQRSLALQGGPFSDAEAEAFMAQAFAADAVTLRRWDDCAKDAAATPPDWPHYVAVLESARCVAPVGGAAQLAR